MLILTSLIALIASLAILKTLRNQRQYERVVIPHKRS